MFEEVLRYQRKAKILNRFWPVDATLNFVTPYCRYFSIIRHSLKLPMKRWGFILQEIVKSLLQSGVRSFSNSPLWDFSDSVVEGNVVLYVSCLLGIPGYKVKIRPPGLPSGLFPLRFSYQMRVMGQCTLNLNFDISQCVDKDYVLRDVTTCRLVNSYRRFEGAFAWIFKV
jgi:hypothetical protein